MQLGLDSLLNEPQANSLKSRYDKLKSHDRITLQQLSGIRNLFDGFLHSKPEFGFAKEEYNDVFLFVKGKYIDPDQSKLAIRNIDELVLSNKKPDVLKHINISWATTNKEPTPPTIIEKRKRALVVYLEAPKTVRQSVVIHYVEQYATFMQNLERLKKAMNTGHVASYKEKQPILTHVNKQIYVNSKGKKDENASKKFDDTLIDVMECRAVLFSLLSEVNKFIGYSEEYMINTLKIAEYKHGTIHPKSKSIKIKTEFIMTPISPMLWTDCNNINSKALQIKSDINALLNDINSLDLSNHKYLKRKNVQQRIEERQSAKKRKAKKKKEFKKKT
eukprot:495864_1